MKIFLVSAFALSLGACSSTHSSVTMTPIGPVAHIESNGASGYREITCVGKVDRGKAHFHKSTCQTSAGRSVGHSVATAIAGSIVPAATSFGVASIVSKNSGPAIQNVVVGSSSVALSGSSSTSISKAAVFGGH